MFGRIIILLASFKYLKITKVVAYYQLTMEFIFELGLPINRGSESAVFVNLLTQFFFVLDYFHFWPTAVACSVVSITNGVAKGYLYSNQLSNIVTYEIVFNVMSNFFNIFFSHIVITACGMLFVNAELLRQGNDALLDGLDEGVIIIDEATNKVTFLNSAAKLFNTKKDEKFSMSKLYKEEEIDQD